MFKTLFIILLTITALFFGAVIMQPTDFKITRSLEMNAPIDKTFEMVNNLEKWEGWSPWAKLDSEMKKTIEGKSGVGAKMSWSGNMSVGEGSMTITESKVNEKVQFKLEFLKPMKATNVAEFTFSSAGNKTLVTWSMTGTNDFTGKAMWLIFNCEKMVGQQFEDGLENLKNLVEVKKKRR